MRRINRRLAPDARRLKATRGQRARADLGEHYLVDIDVNGILATHVDLETLGREIGVLSSAETVA